MAKMKRSWLVGLAVCLMTLMATPAFARGISLKDAGIALWIFIIIGAVIVLLQLIPAAILFFAFISGMFLKNKKKKAAEEAEKGIVLPGYKPATVEK